MPACLAMAGRLPRVPALWPRCDPGVGRQGGGTLRSSPNPLLSEAQALRAGGQAAGECARFCGSMPEVSRLVRYPPVLAENGC